VITQQPGPADTSAFPDTFWAEVGYEDGGA
jgi:hypothetical protein